jgi:hypothetical protein
MPKNEFACFRSLAVVGLAALLTAIAAVPFAPTASAKDNPDDYTRIYTHTYDEVFQAAQEAIARLGWFVTSTDKEKGLITANGLLRRTHNTCQIHIETVSAKPETRVTVDHIEHFMLAVDRRNRATEFLVELQKVLATYK